jgi:hypothetical protein
MKKYLILLGLFLASCSAPVELSSDGPTYYSASSSDGIFFTLDNQPELSDDMNNSSLHLESGLFRKYELDPQDESKIYSYISYDNSVWQKEDGVRLNLPQNARVSAIKVTQNADGTFKMFLEGDGI